MFLKIEKTQNMLWILNIRMSRHSKVIIVLAGNHGVLIIHQALTVLSLLYKVLAYLILTTTIYRAGAINIPILQLKKLRYRKFK